MNLNGLAKYYEHFTPQERLALIVKASLRGDTIEQDRLVQSAPTRLHRLPDYHGQADALQLAVLVFVNAVLERAALYWRSTAVLAAVHGEPSSHPGSERLLAVVQFNAYRVVAECDAWRQLAAELHIDLDPLARVAADPECLERAESSARDIAFTAQEAQEWLRATGSQDAVPTVEAIVQDWRNFLAQRREKWE